MKDITSIKTLGALKKSAYKSKSIKEELAFNLREKLKKSEATFEGIHGYENTVIPELERAILSKHNINLLGLRGQAKTRLARKIIHLLDEYIPIISGSELNDDPLQPVSRYAIELIKEKGDDTPISWLHRSERFFEKLATPDVTVSDIIGDVDPIKAANLKLSYADDRVIHYGMIPRANRCIFVINELPDLQARIQVSLFNILQEGDIQIRGFKVRLLLDIEFVFTANPEDYTNRGSIITPLKDRIGSQILTHYPESIDIAKHITSQEVDLVSEQEAIYVPALAKDLLENIAFLARTSPYIDQKSGVSARMSITAYQNLISTAERRSLLNGESKARVRLSDFTGIIPSITGKVELVYEGEQEGASFVANELIKNAVKDLFKNYFPKIEKLEKPKSQSPYQETVDWFLEKNEFLLLDDATEKEYIQQLESIKPIVQLIKTYKPDIAKEDMHFWIEFVLWALVEYNKLNKDRIQEGFVFSDTMDNYLKDLNN
ncbi:MAG: magnesium chelatase [Bacteroidota bacterium]